MDDLISRQAAIDFKVSHGINENGVLYVPYGEVKMFLESLSSAQPKIIRCKDCVHYEISRLKKDGTDDKRYKRTVCVYVAYARYRPSDWYCADAERRTDDER